MLSAFRRFLNTWVARVFFIVLVASFGLWGVADVVRNLGNDTAVAKVGDHSIEPQEVQEQFSRQLAQVTRMLGGKSEPTPAIRRAVAEQTLDRLVNDAAISTTVAGMGVTVPDTALVQAVRDMPVFRGSGGAFSRPTFDAVLRNNNLTEARFMDGLRTSLAERQLMEAVQAGVASPDILLREVFAFQHESRVAEYVELPFDAAPKPPAPTDDDLQRFYENNANLFSAPEFRRIKAVVLSPETVARSIEVPDADIAAYYEQHKAEYVQPEKRSVQVVVAGDEAQAHSLAAAWTAGASWDDIQHQAETGASAIALDDTTQPDIPSPELGAAVFAAAPDAVTGPVASGLGWQVFRVTKVSPGSTRSLEQATADIRGKIALERASDSVYDRANKLEDALSSSPTLDEIPTDIGAAAVEGSLDAKGNTPSGDPAPIPGPPSLRQPFITAAFAINKGEPPRMTEGPDASYFGLIVEDTTPAALKPYADVAGQVREEWTRAARRRSQEQVAARLLSAVKAGGNLDDAATVAGLRLQRSAPVVRGAPAPGVAGELVGPLFALKLHEPTMTETPDAFFVMMPAEITSPDPSTDPADAERTRKALTQSLVADTEATYVTALRQRLRPTVNVKALDSIANP